MSASLPMPERHRPVTSPGDYNRSQMKRTTPDPGLGRQEAPVLPSAQDRTTIQATMQSKNNLVVGNYEVTVDRFLHYGPKIGCYHVENYRVIARTAGDLDEQWPCTLRKIPFASADLRKMCEAEERIFSQLKDSAHPSAVKLLGTALVEHSSVTKTPLWDVFYLFSETERGSLWDFIQEQKTSGRRIPEEKIIRIAINVVDAVALLHSSEPPLIHRNITPRNIIETTSEVFKLSSFISAAFAPPRRFRTPELLPLREDLACFTEPVYRSPEMMDLTTEAGITTHSVSILKKEPTARPTASSLQISLRAALKSRSPILCQTPRLVFSPKLRDSLTMPRESYILRDLNGKDPSLSMLWYPDDDQAWVKAPKFTSLMPRPDDATSSDEPQADIPKRRGTLTGRTRELPGIAVLHRRTQSLHQSRSNRSKISEDAVVSTNVPNTAPIIGSNVEAEPVQKMVSAAPNESIKRELFMRHEASLPKTRTVQGNSGSSRQERSSATFVTTQRTAGARTTPKLPRSSTSHPEVLLRSTPFTGTEKRPRSNRAYPLDKNDLIRESEEDRQPPFQVQGTEPGAPSVVIDDIGSSVTSVSSVPVKVNGRFCDVFEGMHVTAGKVALKRPRIGATGYDEGVIRLHETADAICYLHRTDVVHGDIKGSNILISDRCHILLCDFGLTKVAPSQTSTSLKGAGTVRWQSPELWENASKSFTSDVYAFGMTIVEVLKGAVPFAHYTNDMAVMLAIIRNDERPSKDPISSPTGISYKRAWRVAAACWAKEPTARPPILEAFRYLSGDPSLAHP
ncbi:hypothetical protein FS837_008844 [Tulasnella sp. UAMH 9824]|nr:hypothetical protein FS837_008844 [Tulasnella sp. UAMH 9824]